MSDPHPAPPAAHRVIADADTVAHQLLTLGWVVRSQHTTGPDEVPLLLVSRTAFDDTPATVHVLPHHHLELEAHTGVTVDVDDLADLHHHLKHLARVQPESS